MSSNFNTNPYAGPPHASRDHDLPSIRSQPRDNSGSKLNKNFDRDAARYQPLPRISDSFSFTAPHPQFLPAPNESFDSVRWSPTPHQSILTGPNSSSETPAAPYRPFSRASHSSSYIASPHPRYLPAPNMTIDSFRQAPEPYQASLPSFPGPNDSPDSFSNPLCTQIRFHASPPPCEWSNQIRSTPAPSQAFSPAATLFTDSTDSIGRTPAPVQQISHVSSPLPDPTKLIRITRTSAQRDLASRESSPAAAPPVKRPRRKPAGPSSFKCAITFAIYCPEKKPKKKEPVWVCFRQPRSGCLVHFNPAEISWSTFQTIVKDAASVKYKHMGHKIEEGTNSTPWTINWSAYILRDDEWPKSSPTDMHEEAAFSAWMEYIVASGRNQGGIQIMMENPQEEATRARKEDLLTKNVLKAQSRLSTTSQSQRRGHRLDSDVDEENSSSDEYEDLEIYANQIYEKYAIIQHYDPLLPSYPHPADPERYIILSSANVDVWAKALAKRTPGVTLESPPSSIKYETHSLASPRKQFSGLTL